MTNRIVNWQYSYRMSVLRTVLLALLLTFNTQSVAAVELMDLYKISVRVENQSEQARTAAVSEAYQALIVRLSGSEKALFNELVQRGQASAESLITSLRYQKVEEELYLQLEFAEGPITQLLVRAGESIWGNERPLVTPWIILASNDQFEPLGHESVQEPADLLVKQAAENSLALEDNSLLERISSSAQEPNNLDTVRPEAVDSESLSGESEVAKPVRTQTTAFSDAMAIYGLPLIFPTVEQLADFNLSSREAFADLITVSDEAERPLSQSLQRLAPLPAGQVGSNKSKSDSMDALLVGYIDQRDSIRVVRLSLQHDGAILPINFVDQTGDLDAIARRIAIQVASALSAKQAISYAEPLDGDLQQVQLKVSQINSFDDYVGVMEYLSQHLAVKSLSLNRVVGDQIQIELNLATTWSEAQRVFARDKRIAATPQPSSFIWINN